MNLYVWIFPAFFLSRTTIKAALNKSSNRMYEGHFYFDSMANHFSSTGSTFAFAAEDYTGVIGKVTYDSSSNSFVGFATPMTNTHPQAAHFQTDSNQELETWFAERKKSSLINANVLQPIPASSSPHKVPSPFILSAYGVDSSFTSDNVLARWRWIYDQSVIKGIRIIGFSTDCDNRYLSSMHIASGVFTSNIASPLREHPDAYDVNLPSHWTWYYLDARQLFVFMQVRSTKCYEWVSIVKSIGEYVVLHCETYNIIRPGKVTRSLFLISGSHTSRNKDSEPPSVYQF